MGRDAMWNLEIPEGQILDNRNFNKRGTFFHSFLKYYHCLSSDIFLFASFATMAATNTAAHI